MDHRYRKKPVIIEAFQMTEARRQNNSEWPEWLHQAWNKNSYALGALYPAELSTSHDTDKLLLRTLEGVHIVSWDDWIIQGVRGELYPCKPDIFEATYEKVDDAKRED